jgi:hypothetical protein
VRHSTLGTPRKLTDEQVRRLREPGKLRELAKECGVTTRTVSRMRAGYQHKRRSP